MSVMVLRPVWCEQVTETAAGWWGYIVGGVADDVKGHVQAGEEVSASLCAGVAALFFYALFCRIERFQRVVVSVVHGCFLSPVAAGRLCDCGGPLLALVPVAGA